MLALSRKKEESILIGNDICIKIGEITKQRVQILVCAPKEVTVLRHELLSPGQMSELTPDCLDALQEKVTG